MKKVVIILSMLFCLVNQEVNAQKNNDIKKANEQINKPNNKYKSKPLIYGPKSEAKIKNLFFIKAGFKMPVTISEINIIAKYTSFDSIEGAGNIYTWDFTNGFQISAITEADGTAGGNDKISVVSFNYGNINSLELGSTFSLNKSTLADIQKIYPKLVKFKKSERPTYKMNNGSVYTTFYFNTNNKLVSVSISNYDLEI